MQTAQAVGAYCAGCGLPADINRFTQMQPFVLDFKARCDAGRCYDMAFVGADGIMGIEVARHIRGMDDMFPLFFVSRPGSDYALEACRLEALHYLIKPVSAQALEVCISRIAARTYTGRRSELLLGGEVEWYDNLHPSPYKRRKAE